MSSFCSTGCLGHGDDDSCEYGFRHHADGVYECNDKWDCVCKWCSWAHLQWLMNKNNDAYYEYDYTEEMIEINNYMNTGEMISYLYDDDAIWAAYDAMRADEEDFGEPNYMTKPNNEKRANRRRIIKSLKKRIKFPSKNKFHGYTKAVLADAPRRVKLYEMVSPEAPRNNAMSEMLHSFKNEKTKADNILMDFSVKHTMIRCKRELATNTSDEIKDELSYFDLFPSSAYTTDSYDGFFDDDWCGDLDEECRAVREADMTPPPDDENDYSYSYEYDDWI